MYKVFLCFHFRSFICWQTL